MSEEFEKSNEMTEDAAPSEEAALDGALAVEAKPNSSKKLIIFGVLVIGAAGLFTLYKQRNGPNAAAAASDVHTVVEQQTIDTFLMQRENGVANMQSMLGNTQKLVQQFLTYPTTAQIPLSDLRTNPFRYHAATMTSPDDDAAKKKREEERLAVIKAVENLQLQSVIHSDTRRACMINNTMYTEGQQIDSFTVEKISPSAVVVKSGGFRFELKMQK
jgi:hypothetical protein